jgi:arylsulfatase A-like enzyme
MTLWPMARPGIAPGSTLDFLGTQVDLAPTILEMAGLTPPAVMDGQSVLPLLVPNVKHALLPRDTRAYLERRPAAAPHRLASFHEYYNQGASQNFAPKLSLPLPS